MSGSSLNVLVLAILALSMPLAASAQSALEQSLFGRPPQGSYSSTAARRDALLQERQQLLNALKINSDAIQAAEEFLRQQGGAGINPTTTPPAGSSDPGTILGVPYGGTR